MYHDKAHSLMDKLTNTHINSYAAGTFEPKMAVSYRGDETNTLYTVSAKAPRLTEVKILTLMALARDYDATLSIEDGFVFFA